MFLNWIQTQKLLFLPFWENHVSALATFHPYVARLQHKWPQVFTNPDSFPISDLVSLIH